MAEAILGGLGFVVRLDAFSGPLDLLLHLLREEQIDIADIPIARIADQFLAAISSSDSIRPPTIWRWRAGWSGSRSRCCCPRNQEGEAWEDPRAELVRRLLEYQQIQEIAHWMAAAADRRALRFARGYLPPPPELPPPPLTLDLLDLLSRGGAGHRRDPPPGDAQRGGPAAQRRGRHAPDAELLAEREEFVWTEALGPRPTISDVLSLLLALLELAKRGSAHAQPAVFAPLVIRRESPRPAY